MILAVSYDNPGDISPGVLGFIVVAALAVAVFFLFRSMNKHLRRVASARDEGRELGDYADGPDGSGGTGSPGNAAGPAGTGTPAGAVSRDPNGSSHG